MSYAISGKYPSVVLLRPDSVTAFGAWSEFARLQARKGLRTHTRSSALTAHRLSPWPVGEQEGIGDEDIGVVQSDYDDDQKRQFASAGAGLYADGK